MQHQVERYPQLEVHLDKLRENLAALKQCCQRSCIDICGIVKAFHGKLEVAQLYEQAGLSSIGSYVSHPHSNGIRTERCGGVDRIQPAK